MAISEGGLCGSLLSPVCDLVGSAGKSAADLALASIGGAFVSAAQSVSDVALAALDATTHIDLTASWFTKNVGVIAAVTLPAVVGLFVLQVIGSVLRREPGGLGRAVLGVGKAMLGSALAIDSNSGQHRQPPRTDDRWKCRGEDQMATAVHEPFFQNVRSDDVGPVNAQRFPAGVNGGQDTVP